MVEEEQKELFTREKLKKQAARISREEELSHELRKAKTFISDCGLNADHQQYKHNSTTKKNVLEYIYKQDRKQGKYLLWR